MRLLFQFRSLASRVGTLVLVALTAFTLAIGVTAYTITSNWLDRTAVSHLEALASARQTEVAGQLRNYHGSPRAFAHRDPYGDVAALLAASGSEQETLCEPLCASMRRKLRASGHTVGVRIVDLADTLIAEVYPTEEKPAKGDV